MKPSTNAGDGRDELGRQLEVTIRIAPDGTIHLQDITLDMLPVALALCPDDPDLLRRAEAARSFDPGAGT